MTHNTDKEKSDRKTPKLERPVVSPPRNLQIERSQRINHALADENAKKQAEHEARRQYHEAWQEYYQQYYQHYYLQQLENQKRQITKNAHHEETEKKLSPKQQQIEDLRKDLLTKIEDGARVAKSSKHFKPILIGVIVILLALLVQYNQLLVAGVHSFTSPGSGISSLIIADGTGQPISQNPELIIPKLSVKAPIIFNPEDQSEASSQEALKNGVLHFPVSGANAKPGEKGNTVVLGHSSADVFSGGNYKFIFVQLNRLVAGDLFYIDYKGVRYAYEVNEKKVISPDDLQQLNLGNNEVFATLITCDPPGTVFNRLLVIAKQISPDPNTAKTADANVNVSSDTEDIPGNPPTLFEKLFR